ncbi:MAG: serine/threonine dehydratase [Pseudomonadota bacterium]
MTAPASLTLPDKHAIEAAATRIDTRVRRTPLLRVETDRTGGFPGNGPDAFTLKLESLQHAGSFKTRGAFNSLLRADVPEAGVAAASGGNHGAAVAYAARALGIKARIFVPEITAPPKLALIRACGADVVVGGQRYADAAEACADYMARTGALSVHAYDAFDTIAGQGTLAAEWDAQTAAAGVIGGDAGELDTVLVAVGGGGLIAGIAAWFEGRVKVVGVEPHGACALHAALAAQDVVDVEVSSVAADSLGAKSTGAMNLGIAQAHVDHVVLVEDDAIIAAQRWLWSQLRLASEPGGAAALAALMAGAYRARSDERVGVLLCGANVDLATLA